MPEFTDLGVSETVVTPPLNPFFLISENDMSEFNENAYYLGLDRYDYFNNLSESDKDYIVSEFIRDTVIHDRELDSGNLNENSDPNNPVDERFEGLPIPVQNRLFESYVEDKLRNR